MDKSEEALPATKLSSPPTPTDDESISTSAASDTFETWTLVTDKNKEKAIATEAVELDEDDANRVEILKQRKAEENSEASEADEEEEEPIEPKPDHDSTTDDLSDGISIISESESAGGRISPHPYLLEHLNNLNLKYSTGDDFVADRPRLATPPNTSAESAAGDNTLWQRRRKRSTSSANTERKALQTADSRAVAVIPIPPIVRRGLAGVFYVGVALAILAFIGKLRYPEWEPLGTTSKPMVELEQKLTDIELQNNLMRAEIDLLSKQVNYLSNRGGGVKGEASQPVAAASPYHRHQHTPQPERKAKTFKAWSGNGNSMDAVDITKGELKHAHKCPDGKFVEIAGMCVENKPDIEPLVDQFGNAVNDILQQSETFKLFEKMAEEYHASSENPFETEKEEVTVEEEKREAKINGQWKEQQKHNRREEKSRNGWDEKRINRRRDHKNSAESHENDSANSKERKYDKKHNNANNHKGEYNSSEERFSKRTTNDSKERFSKHEQKARGRSDSNEKPQRKSSASSEEVYRKDGQWQEQLMQHRENARRQNERQRNNKNWYIERASSREQMRHGDLAYR